MDNGNSTAGYTAISRADWFLVSLLGISLILNVVLGATLFRVSGVRNTTSGATGAPPAPRVGQRLPPLRAHRLDGQPTSINVTEPGGLPTLLYVFTPSCKWCERNLENMNVVLKAAHQSHRVVALSLDPNAAPYVERVGWDNLLVLTSPDESTKAAYGLGPTPQTLIIGTDGKVVTAWVGAYGGPVKREVEKYFSVQLPGLSPKPVDSTQ